MLSIRVITVFLVAVAMALTLAHVLEYPGKMRLSRERYLSAGAIHKAFWVMTRMGSAGGAVDVGRKVRHHDIRRRSVWSRCLPYAPRQGA